MGKGMQASGTATNARHRQLIGGALELVVELKFFELFGFLELFLERWRRASRGPRLMVLFKKGCAVLAGVLT